MLELMARGGRRIGEVLDLTARDVEDRKLTVRDANSSNIQAFISQLKKR